MGSEGGTGQNPFTGRCQREQTASRSWTHNAIITH